MAKTRNLLDVIRAEIANDSRLRKLVEREAEHSHLALEIYQRRTERKLTQKELAKLAGTSQTVIARLESADYSGHSFSLVRRIADAMGCIMRVELYHRPVPIASKSIIMPQAMPEMTDSQWHDTTIEYNLGPGFMNVS